MLFSEQEQQLHRLEGAGALLAPLLQRGATFGELAAELTSRDVEGEAAHDWVTSLLRQLGGMSLLRADLRDEPSPTARQLLQLPSFGFQLSYSSDELRGRIAPIFSHLEHASARVDGAFLLAEFGGGLVQVREQGEPAVLLPRDLLAVRLKGMLLQRLLDGRDNFAALHAALLSDGEHGVLLLGSPGAGKTTLSLALLGRGYSYGSDDVTLLNPDGSVTGVPLAPGVKEGSWPIAEALGTELTAVPPHVRPDGRTVRFAKIGRDRLAPISSPVSAIVVLRRSDGAAEGLQPLGSEEALAELLRESRASDGTCSVETMSALAQLVRGAAAFRLHYSEAMQAADLIAALREP